MVVRHARELHRDLARRRQGLPGQRFCKEEPGLREVKAEVGFGGFVWVNLDDASGTLEEYIGAAMDMLEPYIAEPLEVFHYHRAIVNTNYKLWHDTNSEFYHDYMHYFNRITGMMQPGYFDRKYTALPERPRSVGSMAIKYDEYEGSKERGVGWPGLAPGGWYMIDIFPGMTYNLRTSVLRMDTAIPLGPNKVAIEFRGLGPEERHARAARRARPRPQHDLGPVRPQPARGPARRCTARAARCASGTDSRWVLHGREENSTIHDEGGMRHFYAEWSRRMGRPAYDPRKEIRAGQPARATRRLTQR